MAWLKRRVTWIKNHRVRTILAFCLIIVVALVVWLCLKEGIDCLPWLPGNRETAKQEALVVTAIALLVPSVILILGIQPSSITTIPPLLAFFVPVLFIVAHFFVLGHFWDEAEALSIITTTTFCFASVLGLAISCMVLVNLHK